MSVTAAVTTGRMRLANRATANTEWRVVAFAFVIELTFLGGREKLLPVRVESVLSY